MRAVYACLGVLLTAALAAAQTLVGVSGTVRDESGTPLAGVAIDIVSVSTAVTRQTVTDADGRFVITGLRPADDYRVSATGSGLRSFVRGQMLLRAGEPVTLDILLGVGVTERLDVAAPQPDAFGASPSQQIDEGLVRDVPLIDRGFLQLSSLAPGFTGRPDYPDAQGQRYWTHNIVVDGASDFSKWRGAPRSFYSGYGRESIREVTILPELFAATIGGALASVTMATTRAGGNTWSGTTFLFGRHSALAAAPVFAIEKPVGSTAQYGGAIGGPLRPTTFFFGSYDGRRSRDHNIVSSAAARGVAVPTDQDERIAFARVDHRVSNTQSITARINAQFFEWHDEPGALTLPGTGTAYTNNAYTALLTQATQLSPLSLNDLRVEVSRYVDRRTDLRPVPFVSRSGYSIEGGLLGPAGLGVDPEHTFEVHDTLLRATGSHSLHLGATASVVHAHATGSRYQRGAYFFAGAPAVAPQPYLYIQSVPAGPDSATVDSRSTVFAAFLQDDWRAAANLTVSAGVRYDVEQVHHVENFSAPLDANNVQPRLGVVWRPRESSTVVRAAFGLYTQQHVLDPIDQVQLQGIGGMATIVMPADAAGFPRFPDVQAADVALRAAPHDIYRVATEFRNAYSLQAGAGVERAIRKFTISADYLHLNGYDLLSVIDVNAPASLVKPAQRTVAEADATRPLTPDAGYRKLLTIGNLGRSWYRALQVKASGGTPSLRTVAAYTFAHADDQGNYELPEDSQNLSGERGRAAVDIRHNLTGAVTWQLPGSGRLTRGWSIATLGVARSSRPYTVIWGDDRNGTTQNDARPGGRNTGQTGPYRVMDLSLSKRATVRRAAIETRLEVFNVFSTVNYDEYVRALLSPTYGQPISAFPRRRAQFAVVVRF